MVTDEKSTSKKIQCELNRETAIVPALCFNNID